MSPTNLVLCAQIGFKVHCLDSREKFYIVKFFSENVFIPTTLAARVVFCCLFAEGFGGGICIKLAAFVPNTLHIMTREQSYYTYIKENHLEEIEGKITTYITEKKPCRDKRTVLLHIYQGKSPRENRGENNNLYNGKETMS